MPIAPWRTPGHEPRPGYIVASMLGRPSLSIVCGTNHPGPVVAAMFEPLRDVADEILIGADDRVDSDTLDWYASVADVLVTFPFTGAVQFRGWLRDQAQGDWILFLDGDETASQGLIDHLPDLIADRYVAAYAPRQDWLFPDPTHRLASRPWSFARNPRLLRNDDRLWFPSTKHTGPETTGPVKRTEFSFFHYDLLLRSEDSRRAKVDAYDDQAFGHLTGGRPTNAAHYLPEDDPARDEVPLEGGDRALAEHVWRRAHDNRLNGLPRGARSAHVACRASVDDIQRTLPWTRFLDVDARATIEVLDHPTSVPAGSRFMIELRVRNDGQRTWPSGASPGPAVNVASHWMQHGTIVVPEGIRTSLPHPLRPGESTVVSCWVEAPEEPEPAVLLLDVVVEGDRWFGVDHAVNVEIAPHLRVTISSIQQDGMVPLAWALDLRRELVFPGEIERLLVASGASDEACRLEDEFIAAIREAQPGLLEIDDPSLSERPVEVFDALRASAADTAAASTFVMRGAWSEIGLILAERWDAVAGIDVRGIAPIGRGILVGTLSPR